MNEKTVNVRIDGLVVAVEAREVQLVDHHTGEVLSVELEPVLGGLSLVNVSTLDSDIPEFVSGWANG